MKRLHNGNRVSASNQLNLNGTGHSNIHTHSSFNRFTPRVFESAQVKYKKKNSLSPSIARPAKITVTPGLIEIHANDSKFPPIRIKIHEIVKPRRSSNKAFKWLCLEYIQNVTAKFTYIHLEVFDSLKLGELFDTLLYAWSATANEGQLPSRRMSLPNNIYIPNPIPPFSMRSASTSLKTTTKKPRVVKDSALKVESDIIDLTEEGEDLPIVSATVANVTSIEAAASESQTRKEIEKEFNMMADEVYKLSGKDRDNIINAMKEIVKRETEKKKTGE